VPATSVRGLVSEWLYSCFISYVISEVGSPASRRAETVEAAGLSAGIGESGGAAGGEGIGGDGQPNGIGQVAASLHQDCRVGGAGEVEPELTIGETGHNCLRIP